MIKVAHRHFERDLLQLDLAHEVGELVEIELAASRTGARAVDESARAFGRSEERAALSSMQLVRGLEPRCVDTQAFCRTP